MSTVKTNNVQIGQSVTATNNFTWYQPTSPDGTVRLGNGNAGSVTDAITVNSSGNVGIGTPSPGQLLEIRKDQNAATIIKVTNSSTGSGAQARLDLATGTANSYTLLFVQDSSGSPFFQLASGPAITAAYYDMAAHIFRDQGGTERFRIAATTGALTSQPTYDNLAAGSAVVVTSTGLIRRTSSSIKYKKDVEDLDPTLATNAINGLRPVWYRSKNAEGDDKEIWSHLGLIAEEVHEVEPRLVRYRTAEVIYNEDGSTETRELETPEPEDVDYARLSVLLLAKVKELEARIAELEAK